MNNILIITALLLLVAVGMTWANVGISQEDIDFIMENEPTMTTQVYAPDRGLIDVTEEDSEVPCIQIGDTKTC